MNEETINKAFDEEYIKYRDAFPKEYTTPPKREWVGLNDEDIETYLDWDDWQVGTDRSTILEMVRDIEAKLKGKNT